jgi:chromosome segregation ATPase
MMTDLQKEKTDLQLELTSYDRELKQIVDKFESLKHPEKLTDPDYSKLRNEFIDSHPGYKQCSNKISELEKNYKELGENYAGSQKELANKRDLYNNFLDYSKTIEHHFSSINRPLIKKAS